MSFDNNIVLVNSVGYTSELATTALPVNVSNSAPPLTGHYLIATSATTATWQNSTGSTTVSNIGMDGVGVFKQIVAGNIELKKISQASSRITVLDDTINNTVDIEANTGSTSGTLAIGNDARFSTVRIIKVKESNPGAGEFTSIATAIASIVGSSASNRFIIDVGPGIYNEPQLNIPQYVSLRGANIQSTIIRPDAATHHIFNLARGVEISFVTLQNAGTNFAAINIVDCGDFAQLHKVSINDSYIGIRFHANAIDSFIYVEYVDVSYACTIGMEIISTGPVANVTLEDFYILPTTVNNPTYGVFADGANVFVNITGNAYRGTNAANGTAVFLQNGVTFSCQALVLTNWQYGIATNTIGVGSSLNLTAIDFKDNTIDLNISNTGDFGTYTGSINFLKTVINPLNQFSITGRVVNVVYVAKKGGDFTTIQAAIAAITTAAASNTFIINVGPGIFVENPLIMKQYVTIVGFGYQSTFIQCNNPSGIAITGADSSQLVACYIYGSTGPGGVGVYYQGTGISTPFVINDCFLGNNETLVSINGAVNTTVCLIIKCFAGAMTNSTTCFNITSTPGVFTNVTLFGIAVQDFVPPIPSTLLMISGITTIVSVIGCFTEVNPINTSTAIIVQNGAECRVIGSTFRAFQYGLVAKNIGVGPRLTLGNADFSACQTAIAIEHPSTTGTLSGPVDISRTFINKLSTFAILGRDTNILNVSKRGTDFTTISDAINCINPIKTVTTMIASTTITSAALFNITLNGVIVTGAGISVGTTATYVNPSTMTLSLAATASATISAQFFRAVVTNTFDVFVSPGIYTEAPIFVPEYVTLQGVDQIMVVIQPSNINLPLITLGRNATVKNITISGVTNSAGIFVDSTTTIVTTPTAIIESCILQNCQTCIECTASGFATESRIQDCVLQGTYITGIHIDGTALSAVNNVEVNITNMHFEINTMGAVCFDCEGPFASVFMNDVRTDNNSATNITGVRVRDGATVSISSSHFSSFDLAAFEVLNVGAAPDIQLSGVIFLDNTGFDMNILHPNTTGVVSVIAARSKVFVDPTSFMSVEYTDPEVNGKTIVGAIFLGPENSTTADVKSLIRDVPCMGVVDGGTITAGVGLNINISAGFGYYTTGVSPNFILHKLIWVTQALLLSASSTLYIYFDSTGTLTSNNSKPNTIETILLGRVRTDSTTIEIIDATPVKSFHVDNAYDNYKREVFGSIFVSGSIVTANASRELAISSGKYYFSENVYNPSGSISPATFTTYFHVAGIFSKTTGITVVNNTQYDNGVNLVALSAGFYAKHSFYLVGDGANERYMLVFSNVEYATLGAAQSGSLPLPPTYFAEGIVIIASIIVQQGTATIIQIDSQRPFPSFAATSISATVFHGSLLGLLNDDHPQYLLVNGTRAMAADLSIGGFSITNVNLVDGVDVALHESRHLPNGLDPLTTAAPLTNLSATTLNSVGTANSFARSDHTHAINTGTPSTQTPNQANAVGVSANIARADHIHNIPTAAPSTQNTDQVNTDGVATTFSRADHIHNVPTAAPITSLSATTTNTQGAAATFANSAHIHAIVTAAPSTQIPDLANNIGVVSGLARADHIHNIPTAAPITSLSATTTNTQGAATTFANSAHTHAILTGAPSTQTPDQTNTTGVSANLARVDHIHNIPTATPVSIGVSNIQGGAASFANSAHVHQGVHSISSGTPRFGDIVLQQGTGISIVDSSGTFTVSINGSGNNELVVSNGGALNANYTSGIVNINGVITNIAASTIALTDGTINGTIFVSTTGVVSQSISTVFGPAVVPLAIYTTSGGVITSLTDKRSFVNKNVLGLPEISDYIPRLIESSTGTVNSTIQTTTFIGAVYQILWPVSFSQLLFRIGAGAGVSKTMLFAIYQATGGVSGTMNLICSGSQTTILVNDANYSINFGATFTLSPGICCIISAETLGVGLRTVVYTTVNTPMLNNALTAGTYQTSFITTLTAPAPATFNPATQTTGVFNNSVASIVRLLA